MYSSYAIYKSFKYNYLNHWINAISTKAFKNHFISGPEVINDFYYMIYSSLVNIINSLVK